MRCTSVIITEWYKNNLSNNDAIIHCAMRTVFLGYNFTNGNDYRLCIAHRVCYYGLLLRWFLGVTLFLSPWQLTRESLHAAWHGTNQLVHNNHLTEAEASISLAIFFGWIVSTLSFLSKPQLSHQRAFIWMIA